MAYQALYRQWRPQDFSSMVGQEAIIATLRNQIMTGRIAHAYLFCGSRGTGKTSTAKIMARAINCLHPVQGDPCGECESCKRLMGENSLDILEIDAASNNGVDEIRDLRETVKYPPQYGKYKVYIIDEVHMLSASAFNALLKTLEEPPAYVIFILATTEPHKIPVTVLSRCQRYDFRRITADIIADRLRELADYEKVDIEEKAVHYIAKKADGAMRDALSLMDQCIAFHIGEALTYDKVLTVLGAVDNEVFSQYLRSTFAADTTGLLLQIEEIVMSGRELSQFVQDLVWYMRNLLLLKTSEVGSDVLDLTEEDWIRLQEESRSCSEDELMRLIRIYSELYNQMRNAVNKRVLLEVAAIKTARPAMEQDLESVLVRLDQLEQKVREGVTVRTVTADAAVPVPKEAAADEKPVVLPQAEWEELNLITEEWDRILNSIERIAKLSLAGTRVEPRGAGHLGIVFYDNMNYNMCRTVGALEQVKQYVEEHYSKTLEFDARLAATEEKTPTYVSDADLSVFHTEIEIEEDE